MLFQHSLIRRLTIYYFRHSLFSSHDRTFLVKNALGCHFHNLYTGGSNWSSNLIPQAAALRAHANITFRHTSFSLAVNVKFSTSYPNMFSAIPSAFPLATLFWLVQCTQHTLTCSYLCNHFFDISPTIISNLST